MAKTLAPGNYSHVNVVGGGWSVKRVDVTQLQGLIIGVNDSAIHLPRCDIAVTMDRRWMEYRYAELKRRGIKLYARSSIFQNIVGGGNEDWIVKFKNDNGKTGDLATSPDALYGNNSGACAINLVAHLRPEHAWFLGFDMKHKPNQPYWYPTYPWALKKSTRQGTFDEWAKLLDVYMRKLRDLGIHVTVVSDHRWSKNFPIVTTEEFKEFQRA